MVGLEHFFGDGNPYVVRPDYPSTVRYFLVAALAGT